MPKIFRIAAIRSLDFVLLGIHQPPAFLCFCPTIEEAGNQREKRTGANFVKGSQQMVMKGLNLNP